MKIKCCEFGARSFSTDWGKLYPYSKLLDKSEKQLVATDTLAYFFWTNTLAYFFLFFINFHRDLMASTHSDFSKGKTEWDLTYLPNHSIAFTLGYFTAAII